MIRKMEAKTEMELKTIRRKLRKTQCQLAEEIGVAESTICMYEKKQRKPSIDKIILLSKALYVSTDEILSCFTEKKEEG